MAATLLPKQRLKDYCRRKQYSAPLYILTDEEKIDLHKHYTIQVSINGLVTADGRGLSRRIAEFKAAMNAMQLIGQSDPSVFDNPSSHKFGRSLGFGRSFSVDQISRAQRTDSMPSMMSLAIGPGQFSSAAPSIDGIDSLTENGDSLYGSETANGKDDYSTVNSKTTTTNPSRVDEEEASSDSIDEGVYVETSESSSTPSVSSPTSSAASRETSVAETERTAKVVGQTQLLPSTSTEKNIVSAKSKSLSSSFLSSFFMLSSLRAISRRSLRRKSSSKANSSNPKAEFSLEESTSGATQSQSRPTSATSATSTSSSSSAFSSNSSISSSQQSSSNSSTSGSFTLPDDSRTEAESSSTLVNGVGGYSNLITESIIEEEEEDEEDENETTDSCKRKDSTESSHSVKLCYGHGRSSIPYGQTARSTDKLALGSGSQTMPRSASSSYVHGLGTCTHNHFSIYGPVLCSNVLAAKNLTIESTPSAALLRYCVRMYLPLPYYDIRFDTKFYVTCRVLLTTSKSDKERLPVTLPSQYKDHEFTARGNGETLRQARNMAAQTIIDKLKKVDIFFE